MGSVKRGGGPGPVVDPGFNTPFRELGKSFQPRPAAPSKPAATKPIPLKPIAPARSVPPPTPPRDEAVDLSEAYAGARPLEPAAPRVFLRRRPDLSHIEAKKKEDLDALARGEGFDVTFEEHYVRARAAGVSRETLARIENGEFPISAHLDLHGLPLEDARRAVDEFLVEQQKKGHRCVLLITGKGKNSPGKQGVLREQVPTWLASGPSSRRILAFASARACDGGVGALVVLLRRDSSSKNRIEVERGGVGGLRT